MAKLQKKDDLKALRHPEKFYLPSTVDEPNEDDRLWIRCMVGALDYSQEMALRQVAERPAVDDAGSQTGKTLWSQDVAEWRLPFLVGEHESSEWNVEVVKDEHDMVPSYVLLERTEANMTARILPSNLRAFGKWLWPKVQESLGIRDDQIVENMTGPLETTKDTSPKSDDSGSTDTTPATESPEASMEGTSLLNISSFSGNSERQLFPTAAE